MIEVTVQLPDEIAKQFGAAPDDIPRHILEAIAVEGYRSAKLSREQVGELLHFNTQQTDQFLAERQALSPSLPDASLPETDLDWEAFRRALPRLLETAKGKYVAISNGRIIDIDPDQFVLVERITRQQPDHPIRIQRVVEGGLEDIHLDPREFEICEERGV